MPLANLRPTSKSITLLIVAAVVLFFVTLFSYFAFSSRLNAVRTEFNAKQKEVESSEKIAQRLTEAEVKFAQTQAQLQYLETSVSTKAYVPTLLKQLEALGKEVNLKVVSVRPASQVALQQPVRKLSTDATNPDAADKSMAEGAKKPDGDNKAPEKPKPYDPLTIDIDVEGSYWNTMSFLYRVTSFPKIMCVNYIHLAPTGPIMGLNSPSLAVKLNLTAYVFHEEKAPVPPSANDGSVSVTSRVQPDWRQKNEAG